RVEQKRSALRPEFVRANTEIENFANFNQRVIQSDRFEASRTRVLNDAELTGAIVGSRLVEQGGRRGGTGLDDLDDLDDLGDFGDFD
ncbi:MAG: hypothetical protein LBC85_03825, partial [Fibromonadaceae bacterium]|nr:hypothetical protein [Fibromonadaceae bacterium]